MRTAEDLKRLIEGFSSDVSAIDAQQFLVIRNCLLVHIYIPTQLMQQSIVKSAKMVAFIHAGILWEY